MYAFKPNWCLFKIVLDEDKFQRQKYKKNSLKFLNKKIKKMFSEVKAWMRITKVKEIQTRN